MNKKGMTLVEIVVAISLISVVMIFLFQVLITVTNGNKRNNSKSKTIISKTLITKAVEHDLDAFGLNDPSASIINCSNNIDTSTINQILPATVEDGYYCIKLIYNENNIKNNEGYILFYKNNSKGFLAYKRGKKSATGFILETQVVREIDAYPKEPSGNIYKLVQEDDIFTLKIDIPIIAEDGNNYDLTINYISSKTINEASPSPEEPEIACTTFAEDEWKTIKECINNRDGDTSVYSLDKTDADKQKTITIDGKDYTVRIANDSHYDCKDDSGNILESKTACGFVVEFVDIITTKAMKPFKTNVGGWPATEMLTYLNEDFLLKLPDELQKVIANTKVVSGYGQGGYNAESADGNWISTDKIYLLSAAEVWTDGVIYDTARKSTRQLDYYEKLSVTINNINSAIKLYNGTAAWWWLRSAISNGSDSFLVVYDNGNWTSGFADDSNGGVSPAFRIGDYEQSKN